jgi:predicted O-linked N-acetylglucosamine transferase (SPINDLY family)
LICLPHSYFPTDYAAQEMGAAGTRADHGLPEGVLVLCCFNATYKISPREFDIWMRVLGQIAGSVLWLYRSNPQAERQLRGHAAARGIDPARLIFAGRLPNEAHLERHAHADLFCDTFCYNAHTTAVDALWAGLPVVTRAGEQFAARVAAGLLHAAGLTELVTHTDAEYEALIVELAQDRARLAEVRAKLAAQRSSAPLFDTAQYTRHFEAGLDAAYARWLAGLPPADISVAA